MFDNVSFSLLFLTLVSWPLLKNSFYKLKINMLFFLTISMLVIIFFFFMTSSFFFMFALFEMIIIPIMVSIIGWGYQYERLQAASYLLLYTIFFSFPFFICLLYFIFITMNTFIYFYSSLLFSMLSFFLYLPFFVKLPLIFVHFWLPKAHVEAPTLGSIILASLLLKLGGYGVIRFMDLLCSKLFFFLILSAYGMVVGTLVCIFQSDTKSLVAYLSIAHMNFMLLCILLSYYATKTNSIILMVIHGFSSGMMFFCVGMVYYFVMNRSLYFNHLSLFFFPMVVFSITMSILSNFSVPPFISVFSEIYFFSAIYLSNKILFFLLLSYCMLMAYVSLFFLMNFFHGNFYTKKFYQKNFVLPFATSFFLICMMLNWKMLMFFF